MGAGVISAIAASLCCITPVLAIIAGSSGLASTFLWIEPARPYLIGMSFLVLGFAWYQKLKPKPVDDCGCEAEKEKFIQTKTFLFIVTIFAAMMITFPLYSNIFFTKNVQQTVIVDSMNVQLTEFKISGMTCEGCTQTIEYEVNKILGVLNSEVSYKNNNAQIRFDSTKTTNAEIEKIINSTGYKVISHK